jgi:hypothetical protein
MKSEEGKAWPFASRGVEKDIQPVIIETLKACIELGRPFGIGYIGLVLRGTEGSQFVKTHHLGLKCFGALSQVNRDALSRVMHHMVDEGYLQSTNDSYNVVEISEKGRNYLEHPEPAFVHFSYLRITSREGFMYQRLRALRKALAEELQMADYMVFTDFTMDRLVMRNPDNAMTLSAIPGINAFKLDTIGNRILTVIQESLADYGEIAQRRIAYFNSKPDHQYVKRQVEEGKSFVEICKAMTYDYTKVEGILMDLGSAHEVELTNWIERQVDAKVLFRATDFFRKAQSRNIHQAKQTLRLDQPTLHLARLYVRAMEEIREPVSQAG